MGEAIRLHLRFLLGRGDRAKNGVRGSIRAFGKPPGRSWSHGGLDQLRQTHEVVPSQGDLRPELVPLHTAVP